MNRSTFNHGKSGDTNPKGRSRSPLLKLYPRLLRSEREEIIGHRASAACGGRPRLCYTLDEGKETERETTNCPPKRVRSNLPPLLSRSRSAPLTNPTRVLMRTADKSQLRLAQTHSILIQPFNFHPHKPLSVRYRTHCARQATSRCGRRTCRRDVRRGNCRWACRAPAFGADTSRSLISGFSS